MTTGSAGWAVYWTTPADVDLGVLDSVERERHAAYRKDADRRRFATGRLLAKTVVAERLGLRPADVTFDATCPDCGKPHGPPRFGGVALSISHSGDRVGLAVTDGPSIGLDVESVARNTEDSLIRYALNETELAALGDRRDGFFTYWTRKEALMKATGRGLRIPLRGITVSGPDEPARLLAAEDSLLNPADTRLLDLNPGDGYRAAVAILTPVVLPVTEHWWPDRTSK